MSNIQLNEAYADWVTTRHYDLVLTLNAEQELTYEQMSKLLFRFSTKHNVMFLVTATERNTERHYA